MLFQLLLQFLLVVLTAVLTSVLTLALARRQFERLYRQELEERLKLALDEVGQVIEDRVRKGVLDAVAEIPSSEMIQNASRTVARTGASLVEGGLSALLGGSRTRRRDSGD